MQTPQGPHFLATQASFMARATVRATVRTFHPEERGGRARRRTGREPILLGSLLPSGGTNKQEGRKKGASCEMNQGGEGGFMTLQPLNAVLQPRVASEGPCLEISGLVWRVGVETGAEGLLLRESGSTVIKAPDTLIS